MRGRRVRLTLSGGQARLGVLVVLCGVGLAVAALAGGCEPTGLGPPKPVLLFSGNNEGVLAACGCPSNPSGGLAKREGLIESYRNRRPAVVLVDAGDLFPDYQYAIKAKYVAKAAGRQGYDAIGLGDQEFCLGLARLQEFRKEFNLPLVCSNVRDAATGRFVVEPHIIREVAGRKIGIFSVIADQTYGWPPVEWRTGLKVEPPVEAARREVRELAGCDLIVGISHQSIHETRQLAADVPGIHVLISGHDENILPKGEKIGQTLLVATGGEGRVMGAVSIAGGSPGKPKLTLDMTELSLHVPDTKWVMDMYWEYVKEAKDNPPPDWNDVPIPAKYEPAETCGKCHPMEYKHWLTTAHSRTYETIRKTGRQDDPECLLCHTMGLGRPGGFVSMAKTPPFARVTCQGCHAVTSDHADRKIKPEPKIKIHSRLCMSCHGPVQSPNFDYFTYKPKILHRPVTPGSTKK